jgi:D-alanyl-lipoteichoic acid acyltransferase DltB (MBOAT superfamily)
MISGLWHGANWTFILWGALHGFYLISAIVLDRPKQKLLSVVGLAQTSFIVRVMNVVITFSLASFAWIFFRANSIHDAFAIIQRLFAFEDNSSGLKTLLKDIRYEQHDFILAALAIIVMETIHFYQEQKGSVESWINARPIYVRWGIYYGALLTIIFLGVWENRQFIYFQF